MSLFKSIVAAVLALVIASVGIWLAFKILGFLFNLTISLLVLLPVIVLAIPCYIYIRNRLLA